jgi:tripartite-type tricarboxylate transporter receptor subunit TctC
MTGRTAKYAISLGGLIIGIVLLLFQSVGISSGTAAGYPSKPVRVIIPSAAGGTNDQVSRMVNPLLAKYLGVPVIIENIPGAGGLIAYSKFAKEKTDGYSILSFNFISPVVFELIRKTEYVTREYSPIAGWNVKNFILAVHVDGPKNFAEFLDLARQRPVSMAVTGGSTDIQMYALEGALGIKFNGIRYKSGNECTVAVAGKHVDAVMTFAAQLNPLIRAGKIRPLAVFSAKSDPSLPGVPTIGELGHPKVPCLPAANGFAAPPHTPKEIVAFLEKTVQKVTADPQSAQIAEKLGVIIDFASSKEVGKMIADYYSVIAPYKNLIAN